MVSFRKRINILPGVNLNISKTGVSANIGKKGANVTLGGKSTLNLGIPGTGISNRSSLGKNVIYNKKNNNFTNEDGSKIGTDSKIVMLLICAIFGFFGLHRYYFNRKKTALLMLFTLGFFGWWVLFDFLLILFGKLKYNKNKVSFLEEFKFS